MAVALMVALGGTGFGSAAWAQTALDESDANAAEVYVVRGVPVDVTAETAAAARDAAYAEGHAAALERLFARILPLSERPRVPPLEPAQVAELVANFDVADERTSQVRYLARLTFRFNPEAVRTFLRVNDIPHAEARSKPVLVLPISGPRGEARLWDDPTPWYASWAARPPGEGLVPLIVPLGDLADIAAISAEQALAGDAARLAALAARYGAEDVLVVQAIASAAATGEAMHLQISSTRIGREAEETTVDTFAQQPDESLDSLFARAAAAVAGDIQERWKRRNLLHPGDERTIRVLVALGSLVDWLDIERRLDAVAGVKRSMVTRMSRAEAAVDIRFVGDERQLALAMAQSDLDLLFDEAEGWRVRVRGTKQPAPPTPVGAGAAEAAPSGPASE